MNKADISVATAPIPHEPAMLLDTLRDRVAHLLPPSFSQPHGWVICIVPSQIGVNGGWLAGEFGANVRRVVNKTVCWEGFLSSSAEDLFPSGVGLIVLEHNKPSALDGLEVRDAPWSRLMDVLQGLPQARTYQPALIVIHYVEDDDGEHAVPELTQIAEELDLHARPELLASSVIIAPRKEVQAKFIGAINSLSLHVVPSAVRLVTVSECVDLLQGLWESFASDLKDHHPSATLPVAKALLGGLDIFVEVLKETFVPTTVDWVFGLPMANFPAATTRKEAYETLALYFGRTEFQHCPGITLAAKELQRSLTSKDEYLSLKYMFGAIGRAMSPPLVKAFSGVKPHLRGWDVRPKVLDDYKSRLTAILGSLDSEISHPPRDAKRPRADDSDNESGSDDPSPTKKLNVEGQSLSQSAVAVGSGVPSHHVATSGGYASAANVHDVIQRAALRLRQEALQAKFP